MILVTLNIANFEYDIHSLVKAFFPREEVCVTTEDKVLSEAPFFSMNIIYYLDEKEGDTIFISIDG